MPANFKWVIMGNPRSGAGTVVQAGRPAQGAEHLL
jgi:hypothetical protein